jgi:hypothetical protein
MLYTKALTELPFYMQFVAEAEKFTCHGPKSFPTSCDLECPSINILKMFIQKILFEKKLVTYYGGCKNVFVQ